MKKIFLFIFIFISVILIVPVSVYFNCIKSNSIMVSYENKSVKSDEVGVNFVNKVQYKIDDNILAEEEKEVNEEVVKIENNVNTNKTVVNVPVNNTQNVVKENIVVQQPVSDVLETQIGKMTSYGPDCPGCSGRVSYGQDVRNGNIYYNDSTYGNVRILAGDKTYKFGTIVRIKHSKLGSPIIAIVLDRGGNVGIGKATMFDLLYTSNSEASKAGTLNNCTFEILRYGF